MFHFHLFFIYLPLDPSPGDKEQKNIYTGNSQHSTADTNQKTAHNYQLITFRNKKLHNIFVIRITQLNKSLTILCPSTYKICRSCKNEKSLSMYDKLGFCFCRYCHSWIIFDMPQEDNDVTADVVIGLLKPSYSVLGCNRRPREELMVVKFREFLYSVKGKWRHA